MRGPLDVHVVPERNASIVEIMQACKRLDEGCLSRNACENFQGLMYSTVHRIIVHQARGFYAPLRNIERI